VRIAITGGTGFVGGALVDEASARGHDLAVLARSPQERRQGVEWVSGDLADRQALAGLVRKADLVIHVAGVVKASDHAEFDQGNVAGTLNLLETVKASGPGRFIFVSSLAAREPGLSAYGASKARAEKLVMASGLDWTILRPPAVYGPRDSEMFDLFRAARMGIVPTPKQGRTSIIHVGDLVDLMLALHRGGEDVTGRIFEPDDGTPTGWDHAELALAIGKAMGKRPWVVGFSRAAMMWAARLDGLLRRRKARLTPDRAAYFSHPDWVVSEGVQPPQSLWRPRIGTREGLKETAEWYRAAGWL
jgi:nucleoside-diphosphate-sugar epimerase